MSIKSRIQELEKRNGSGFHVVLGANDDSVEKEIQDYCEKHDIDRDKSDVMWMPPRDAATL